MPDDRWERLRQRLIAHAELFEDGAAYTAGVKDALTAVRAMLATSVVKPRSHLHVVDAPPDESMVSLAHPVAAPGGLPPPA